MKALLYCLVMVAALAVPVRAADLYVENVTVVSAHLKEPAENQYLLIRDNRIAAISAQPLKVADHAIRFDGTSKFLTPGLTDAHHHVSFAPGLGPLGHGLAADKHALADAYKRQQPRSLLYYGVTQILDPSPLTSWQAFEAVPQHPDLFRCGDIPNNGGYPTNQVHDKSFRDAFPYQLDHASDEAIDKLVRQIAEDGAICVKLYIENGFGTEDSWPIFDESTIRRIGDIARAQGLFLYAHANSIDMYQLAMRSGVDIIGHGLWNWQWPDGEEAPLEETLQAVVDGGTGYVATHRVMAGLAAQLDVDSIDFDELAQTVPGELLSWYRTEEAQWFADELASDFASDMPRAEMSESLLYGYKRTQQSTKWLYESGHPLMFGSDCPGSPTYANHPGLCTRQEIQSHIDAGIPPEAVFVAATWSNAKRLGLGDRYGTVEVGKIGNLLILTEDPTRSAAAWDTIDTVILRGSPIERDSLTAR